MKRFAFLLLIPILLSSCSKDNILNPNSENQSGTLFLKFDRANTPNNIAVVSVKLSREGFTDIIKELDLNSDTSADGQINNIPVGKWHLTVDAKNDSGIVLYSGETDVIILENYITQLSLTLYPVSHGTGGIIISVIWGTSSWTDFEYNPVLSYNNYLGITSPKLLIDSSKVKMWFKIQGASAEASIGYAESYDGVNWVKPINNPVLTPTPGSWDSDAVTDGIVLKDGSIYKMYYRGYSHENGYAVGLAISSDGINWEKFPSPVLTPDEGIFVFGPNDVIKVNNIYYMYYDYNHNIGLATSSDGINWQKYSGNPIIYATEYWEGNGTYFASVIHENNGFKMVYMNFNTGGEWGFGKAVSEDGINWNKSNTNPFFKSSLTANHWASKIIYPFLIKFGDEYRVYYSSDDGFMEIGFVKSNDF